MHARRLPHEPALDGLRGVALLLVLGFHAEVPGFGGGFLGVSFFFTLSGYLITQLLVGEHAATGSIALRRFWVRRVRRLAPASLAGLVLVGALVAATDAYPGRAVPGDLVAALTNVANWRFAVGDTSYADLFTSGPSPVLHFWSLSIEEQFYLLFPLLTAAALRWGRRALAAALVLLAVAGTVASVLSDADLAYYGTHTRAPELLTGSLLGLALPLGRPRRSGRQEAGLAGAGLAAAAGLGLLVAGTSVGSSWLYDGGLPATSLLSAAVIAGATVRGPLRAVARAGPLVGIGRCSYGAYVYHWPLFLLLTEERTGLGGPSLVVVRLAATAALALVSARLLEDPIRRGARLQGQPGRLSLAAGGAAVVALALVAGPAPSTRFEPTGAAHLAIDQAPVVDVTVVGGSATVDSWVRSAAPAGFELRVRSYVQSGCPALVPDAPSPGCRSFQDLVEPVRTDPPDLVVMGLTAQDRAPLELIGTAGPDEAEQIRRGKQALDTAEALLADRLGDLPDVPILVVDLAPDPILSRVVADATLVTEHLWDASPTDSAALADDLAEVLRELEQDDRISVVVVGDSSSMEVAAALDAAGEDRLHVTWAGRTGCPIPPTDEARWGTGLELDTRQCPSPDRAWPQVLDQVRPRVVMVVATLGALSEHRYPGTSEWVVPGDPQWVAAHDSVMADLQALSAPAGSLTLVATVPPLLRGQAYDGPVGDPDRLEAWLRQLERWDRAWRSVGRVDWATIVLGAEAAAGRPLRGDAVHFERGPLVEVLGPRLVEEVLRSLDSVEVEAEGSGCLVEAAGDRRLDLRRCQLDPASPDLAGTEAARGAA